jgi:hypothetical protein
MSDEKFAQMVQLAQEVKAGKVRSHVRAASIFATFILAEAARRERDDSCLMIERGPRCDVPRCPVHDAEVIDAT